MSVKRITVLLLTLLVCLIGRVASAASPLPVAWVLYAQGGSLIPNTVTKSKPVLGPTTSLFFGDQITLKQGERIVVAVFKDSTRRVYDGPAKLKVIKDTVSLRAGSKISVFAMNPQRIDLAKRWLAQYGAGQAWFPLELKSEKPDFEVLTPINGTLLLSKQPEFDLKGTLPRDGKLIVYDDKGRRFWVQPLDSLNVKFPPAAEFEWGKTYTWEIRRLTGGTVLNGQFKIAYEKVAADLISSKGKNLSNSQPQDLLFNAVRLQLLGAFEASQQVWSTLGVSHR